MITAQKLEVRAGARLLMEDVTFRIAAGDKVGLVGRNGAGKTTLTRILAGEGQPASGQVLRSGDIGYLPQDPRVGDPAVIARDRILSARGLDEVVRRLREAEVDMASEDPKVHERGMKRWARADAELHAAPLTAGEGLQRLRQQPVLDPEAARDPRCLRLGGVATAGVQLGVGPAVAAHRPLADLRVVAAHLGLGRPQPPYDVVEPACGEDPVARDHLGVTGARVLRQVADVAGAQHLPGRGEGLPGQDLREGRLAGAVAPHQADLVPLGDPEVDVGHQQSRPGTDLELLGGDHEGG